MKFSPVDIVMVILAVSLSVSLIYLTISPAITKIPRNTEQSKLLKEIFVAIIAIISLYVGSKLGK